MRRRWSDLKKLEISTLYLYGAWLLLTALLWQSEWMRENRALSVFSLLFAAVIYFLLGFVRRMHKFRAMAPGFTEEQAEQIMALRVRWTAELRLIFCAGFAGTTLALLFNHVLRLILVILFFLSVLLSLALFLLRLRLIKCS